MTKYYALTVIGALASALVGSLAMLGCTILVVCLLMYQEKHGQ